MNGSHQSFAGVFERSFAVNSLYVNSQSKVVSKTIDPPRADTDSNRLKKFSGGFDRCWDFDRHLSRILVNPSSDFPSCWITRCILCCMEPIKLLISPMFKFFHSSVRIWMSSHCHSGCQVIHHWRYVVNSHSGMFIYPPSDQQTFSNALQIDWIRDRP
jgi:hypothetical protein